MQNTPEMASEHKSVFKTIGKIWTKPSLVLKIFIGLVIGALLGIFLPNWTFVAFFGDMFVKALKALAPVLVFVLVLSSLASSSYNLGKKFSTVIILYMLSTLIAALVAVVGSFVFPVTMDLVADTSAVTQEAPQGIGQIIKNLLLNVVQNPIGSIIEGNYIGVLFWAIVGGLALRKIAKPETKHTIGDISSMVSISIGWIIQLAPFGIMGLVFSAVSENGLGIFTTYGKLLGLLVGCMLLVALIINPIIIAIMLKKNPYPLVFKCLKESGLTAFFTRSSAANIPVNMQLAEKLGLEKDFYSVSIPLGATINMDGAAITITVMTLAVAHTMGIAVDFPTALILSILATFAACGSSGVAGGSLLLIPMACSLFNIRDTIAIQAVAVGFIIGIIQDSVETALNSSGDMMFTATADYYHKLKKGEEIPFFAKKK